MPTRNVVLTDHHEQVIEQLVRSGRYQNASEVLREGVRLVEQREAEDAAKLAALRAAVQVGANQIDAGDYIDVDDAGLIALFDDMEREAINRVAASRP